MALTAEDKKDIREMVFDTVSLALEEIVVPRFERLENRMGGFEERMDRQEEATVDLKNELRSSTAALHKRIDDLEATLTGRIAAIESDIKEIYGMIARLQTTSRGEKRFARLSLEQKILQTHAQIVATAKEAGIKLPS